MPSRREKIESMLAEDPADQFLRYSLALEQQNAGEHEASLAGLRALTADSPPYIPAFLMGGQQLVALQRLDEARALLRAGIDAARGQNNLHAAGEMSELLASIGFLGE